MHGSVDCKRKADLLHPLAVFHWEHCHTWTNELPKHCAVLNDRVAILTWRDRSGDVLHISSTNLNSWTTSTLPYAQMSLTTYKSSFVAVGGHHPSTYKHTNQLFTSDRGLEWQPSLPPMPTKRSRTSSISTRSPEALVVAGGWVSVGRNLDVVEVLRGNAWYTVNPLPAPCWTKHAIFQDENIYFMGGVGQGATVYTCSCTSLITSCGVSISNITTTEGPVWRQFKAPDALTAAVSYSSHLISIDRRCTMRIYSSVSQSWVEATSAGDRNGKYGQLAAAVLSSGEFVIAHESRGVFKVRVSGGLRYLEAYFQAVRSKDFLVFLKFILFLHPPQLEGTIACHYKDPKEVAKAKKLKLKIQAAQLAHIKTVKHLSGVMKLLYFLFFSFLCGLLLSFYF